MRPLPTTRYQPATWKTPKVNIDYHVDVDRHYYSVPSAHDDAHRNRATPHAPCRPTPPARCLAHVVDEAAERLGAGVLGSGALW
jgi:hypothetical protein